MGVLFSYSAKGEILLKNVIKTEITMIRTAIENQTEVSKGFRKKNMLADNDVDFTPTAIEA